MYEIMAPDVRENASGAGVLKSEVKNLEKRKKRFFFFLPSASDFKLSSDL